IFRNPITGALRTIPVDPVSARIIAKYIPRPNSQGGLGNYLATPKIRGRNDEITGRYFVSDNDTFDPIISNVFLSTSTPPTIPGFGLEERSRTHNLAVTHTHTFSNQRVNELRFGYNRHYNFLDREDITKPSDLGFVNVTSPTGLFDVNLTGISRI